MDIESEAMKRDLDNLVYVCRYSGIWNRGIYHVMEENRNLMQALLSRPDTMGRFPWFEFVISQNDLFFENLLSALRPTFPDVGANDVFPDVPPCRLRPWPGQAHNSVDILWGAMAADHGLMRLMKNPEDIHDCYKRVMFVCEDLTHKVNNNREILEILQIHSGMLESYVMSWLSKIDIFLLDVWQALGLDEVLDEYSRPWSNFRPWPSAFETEQEHNKKLLRERSRQYQAEPQRVNMLNFLIQQGVIIDAPRRAAEVQRNTLQDKQEEIPSPREPEAR